MMYLLIVSVLLFGIYFLSYKTNQLFLNIVYTLTRSKTLAVSLISLLLYPGVVIHELSHLIMAVILFVPVKSMSLVPKMVEENKLQGGSVTIAKVDPLRRTLVGIAPMFVGITVLWLVINYLLPPIPFICHPERSEGSSSDEILRSFSLPQDDVLCNNEIKLITENRQLITIVSLYLIFSISSTMYSSRKDLDALFLTVPLLIMVGIIAYILGFQFVWIVEVLDRLEGLFQNAVIVLIMPIAAQILLFFVLNVFKQIVRNRS
ncbi:MAG: hypothetical protein NUV98_01925 [Candidatus Roizmanbacteria bacterium]|nr:hypothetical protein [Candidatus Roizmanbacteria bacterium]